MRNAIGMRFGVPLAAFRYLAQELIDASKAEDVEIAAEPPGLRLAGTFDLMHTRVRGGAVLFIDRVVVSGTELRVELRLEDVALKPVDPKKTQISALLRANALDLSRPGDLIANLPDMPPMIVSAVGNRIALDLMQVPKLARDMRVRHALGMVTSLISLDRVETHTDHFDLAFRPLPQGFSAVVDAVGEHLLSPAYGGIRKLVPPEIRGELESGISKVVGFVVGEDPGARDDRAA